MSSKSLIVEFQELANDLCVNIYDARWYKGSDLDKVTMMREQVDKLIKERDNLSEQCTKLLAKFSDPTNFINITSESPKVETIQPNIDIMNKILDMNAAIVRFMYCPKILEK